MKKISINRICILFIFILVSGIVSCVPPTFIGSNELQEPVVKVESTIILDKERIDSFNGKDFLRGFDGSMLMDLETAGACFFDENNCQKNPLQILKENGVNTLRLRLWVDPLNANVLPNEFLNFGYNSLEKTMKLSKRAKEMGFRILLDLHYSDVWAHPGQQLWPKSFETEECRTIEGLSEKVYEYTEDVLLYLKKNDALPEYIQIGNEIDSGMFLSTSWNKDSSVKASAQTKELEQVLLSAISAVKNIDCNIETILHVANSNNVGRILSLSLQQYDAIGVSYYPCDKGRSLESLSQALNKIVSSGKRAYVLETSFPYTCEWVSGKNDDMNNVVWYTGNCSTENAYRNLKNYFKKWNIKTAFYENKNVIESSPENQANVLRMIMAIVAEAGGNGFFYWGGDWVSSTEIKSSWENQALFDLDGKVLPAAKVFNIRAVEK